MSRVAVVGGCRTPFVKAFGAFGSYPFLDLGQHVLNSVCNSNNIKAVDELIFSTVLLDPRMPNAARELVLKSNLPASTPAHFISNNCISGLVAVNMATEGIWSGRLKSALAGGSESMSRPALSYQPVAEKFFLKLSRSQGLMQRLKTIAGFRPQMLLPIPPSPKEPSTGLTMGQHCELSAQEFNILRADQDLLAFNSHKNATTAKQSGFLAQEIAPFAGVDSDNLIRANTNLESLAKLKPVFERSAKGSITAGNASSLTDGASIIYLMSEEQARAEGREILGFIDATEFAAIKPNDGLLMAPGIALPKLMNRLKLNIADVDFFEIHEAFSAQVLANMQVWEQGWNKYPEINPIGKIPDEKLNVNGGSLAIGHPFAATGGRLILSALNNLKRTGKRKAVISVCAAGAMACAMLVSRD